MAAESESLQVIQKLIRLRLLVGYLGQGKQAGWWDCNFLDATGIRFLETTFPRTARAAGLRSIFTRNRMTGSRSAQTTLICGRAWKPMLILFLGSPRFSATFNFLSSQHGVFHGRCCPTTSPSGK
jgi:hypothetical protein